nr:trna-dihydrouridine(20/20a) synthase [Quercus suber]
MVAGQYLPPWFSVAPMMDWTDNHYRTLARLISKHAWLYTEMLAAETIVYQKDNLDRFLAYSPEQHPIVLQIGGNNLENLAKATELANPYHYDEINFNCGCPSPKVAGHGCFGARLMLDPKFVGEAMSVIAANTDVPVSVKCRIGVDDHDSYNELCDFIYKVSSLSPTRHFIIHSRKAMLNGISPAENRSVPPLKYEYFYGLLRDFPDLRYEYFYGLLRDFPDLRFTINGGINCVDEVNAARRAGAHGVMVGRAAYHNPWQVLGHVDSVIYGAPSSGITRRQILEKYQVYGDSVLGKYGIKPHVRDVVKVGIYYVAIYLYFIFSIRSLGMACGSAKQMLHSKIASMHTACPSHTTTYVYRPNHRMTMWFGCPWKIIRCNAPLQAPTPPFFAPNAAFVIRNLLLLGPFSRTPIELGVLSCKYGTVPSYASMNFSISF